MADRMMTLSMSHDRERSRS